MRLIEPGGLPNGNGAGPSVHLLASIFGETSER